MDSLYQLTTVSPAQGVTVVFGALQDQFRRIRYEFQGGKFGAIGEHFDADGRYDIAHTTVACPTGLVEPGLVHINPVASDGKVDQSRYTEDEWTSGWTHSETFSMGGKTWTYMLKEGNGENDIDVMTSDGDCSDGPSERWVKNGWTHAQVLDRAIGEYPVVARYKRGTGSLHIDMVGTGLGYGAEVGDFNALPGWTAVEPYRVGSSIYLLYYNSVSGRSITHRLDVDGKKLTRVPVADGNWAAGWATVDTFTTSTGTFLYLHNPATGRTKVLDFDAQGRPRNAVQDVTRPLGSAAFDVDDRRIDPYTTEFYRVGGKSYLLRNDRVSGEWAVRSVASNGTLGSVIQDGRWTPGWSGAQGYQSGGASFLFLVKSGS